METEENKDFHCDVTIEEGEEVSDEDLEL